MRNPVCIARVTWRLLLPAVLALVSGKKLTHYYSHERRVTIQTQHSEHWAVRVTAPPGPVSYGHFITYNMQNITSLYLFHLQKSLFHRKDHQSNMIILSPMSNFRMLSILYGYRQELFIPKYQQPSAPWLLSGAQRSWSLPTPASDPIAGLGLDLSWIWIQATACPSTDTPTQRWGGVTVCVFISF